MNTIPMTLTARRSSRVTGTLLAVLLTTLAALLPAQAVRADGLDLPANSNSKPAAGLSAALKKSAEPDFLPPDQAFRFSALPNGADSIRLIWGVTDGYYLYRARIKASSDSTQTKLGDLTLPEGETKMDEYFGKQEVYHHDVVGSISVARNSSGELTVPLKVTYQGCATAGLCYPPITKVVNVVLPSPTAGTPNSGGPGATGAASANSSAPAAGSSDPTAAGPTGYISEQDRLAAFLRDGNLFLVLGAFLGLGLLLSLTPCILPMIPILSGIIVGEGENITPMRGFTLSLTYSQGMALTYAIAGAIFALAFKQTPAAFFQQTWIILLFSGMFVALALSMFGFFTLQMPSAIQTKLSSISNQQRTGTYIGAFIMGALSALIVSACVAPVLIAALSVISQTGNVARGAVALYLTAVGMTAPLLLVGASAGSLLPKVGAWMDTVKSLFGVMFLALALYFLQRLLPASLAMLLWSTLTVMSGFWIFSLKGRDGSPVHAAVRAPGLMAMVYGILLLIGVASGRSDPLQPLGPFDNATTAAAGPSAAINSGSPALPFETIKSLDDLNKRVAAASAAGRPVILDFYADWCTSCKEMERYTFSDKSVQTALANAVALRADVTRNDAVDQELLHHFNIFGPPTIAFYGADGAERTNFRVVGYMKAAEFASLATHAFQPNLTASRTGST